MKKHLKQLIFCTMLAFAGSAIAGPVNINTADAATLAAELRGVGEKTAQAIVEYREQHGEFDSLEDLKQVKGIGEKVLENNKENIRFSDAS